MLSIWKRYRPTNDLPWDIHRVKHLHRRAGFGATWNEMQRDLADGYALSLDRMLSGTPRQEGQRDDFTEMADVIGEAAATSNDPIRLKAWWILRMLFSPDPLREKLTLMWHNHFATSNLKVQDLLLMQLQNKLLREKADGRFADLLENVLRDPAMLYWLDAGSNRVGHPNENLARELLELFTLGIGHYNEADIKAVARALTGWTVKRTKVRFREERHDNGSKTILGVTRNFDVASLTELLLAQEATANRLAWRLCDTFMGEGVVDEQGIDELATELRNHDLDVGRSVETILRSELFFSSGNMATRISSPVEFVVNSVRSLELLQRPPSTLILADWCKRLGQDLFYPPNVGGWNGGRSWLTSRSIVARSNFAAALVAGELRAPVSAPNLESLAQKHEVSIEQADKFFEGLLLSAPRRSPSDADHDRLTDTIAKLLSSAEAWLT